MNQAEIKKIKKVLLLGSGALKIGEANLTILGHRH